MPAQVWLARGMMQIGQNKTTEAAESFERSLALYRTTLPDDHTTLCWVWSSLGQAQLALGDHTKAEAPLDSALACYRKQTKRTEDDEQELEVTSFYKARLLIETKRDRAGALKMVEQTWRWAHEHGDADTVAVVGKWSRGAHIKLPKLALAKR